MTYNAAIRSDAHYCRYHPMELAVWMHPETHECYCARCVDRDEEAEVPAATSVMGGDSLTYLGSAGDAPAFWNRLTDYLVFPVRWQVLLWWLPLAILGALLVAGDGITPWVGGTLVGVGLSQVALAVLSVTGDGQPLERLRAAMTLIKPDTLVALLLAQVLPLALLVGGIWFASGFVAHLAFVVALLVLPAMVLAALVEQMGGVLSPHRWLAMINGVGWSYGLIVCFLLLLVGINSIAFSLFYGELPDAISKPLLLVIASYSLLVFYRLLGGCVHQFQRGLGFYPHGKPQRKRTRGTVDRTDQTIDMLIRDARFGDLEHYLRQLVKQRPQSQRYQELLGKLLQERGDAEALRQHAEQLLDAALKNEDTTRLLYVYKAQLAQCADYKPASPAVRFAVAKAMSANGEHEAAARMLVNLHNDFPQYPGLGDAYWWLANLLAEELGQPEMAAQCAMYVYKTCPRHPEREAIERFLKGWRLRGEE